MTTSNILSKSKKVLMIVGTAVILAIAFTSCEKDELATPQGPLEKSGYDITQFDHSHVAEPGINPAK